MFWVNYFQNLLWLRNHVVAPLSEEFTFRACMLPLLLQSFTPMTSIFITPLFFGVGESAETSQKLHLNLVLHFSSSPPHDRATSKWNGQENNRHNLVLPILLHVHFRYLLGVSFRPHWTLCGAFYRSRLLQSHGIPRYS